MGESIKGDDKGGKDPIDDFFNKPSGAANSRYPDDKKSEKPSEGASGIGIQDDYEDDFF